MVSEAHFGLNQRQIHMVNFGINGEREREKKQ